MNPIKILLRVAGILGMSMAAASAQTYYNWTTIAGLARSSGSTDGTNSATRFYLPQGIAVDSASNVFVADTCNQTIRKITPSGTNWVTGTIAGLAGISGTNDGTNNVARFCYPQGVAVDGAGNVYVADTCNSTIRKITPSGTNWVTSTIAGQVTNSGCADGTNSDARFNWPSSVAVDNSGNVFVADTFNDTIRKITPSGTNWVTSTIAGLATNSGCADGTNSDSQFSWPSCIAVDNAGNVYVADSYNSGWNTIDYSIRKITPSGTQLGNEHDHRASRFLFLWQRRWHQQRRAVFQSPRRRGGH